MEHKKFIFVFFNYAAILRLLLYAIDSKFFDHQIVERLCTVK